MKKYLLLFSCTMLSSFGLWAQTEEEMENQMSELFNKAYQFSYIQKDSAYAYYQAALEVAVKFNDYESQLDILDFTLSTSDYHYDLRTSSTILDRINTLLQQDVVRNQLDDFQEYWNTYLMYQGNYYYKTKEFEKAKPFFQELLKQYNEHNTSDLDENDVENLFITNNFLGGIYKQTGKYELSEQYFLKNRVLASENEHLTQNKEAYSTSVNILLAQLYTQMNQPEKANKLLADGVKTYKAFYKKDKKFKNNLINAYQRGTENYMRQDSLQAAMGYLNEASALLRLDDPFYKQSLILYGDIYSKLEQSEKALAQYNLALKIFKTYRQNRAHQDIADVHSKIADFFLKDSNFSNGLESIKKALNASGQTINLKHLNENPDPNKVFSRRQVLQLLYLKIQLLRLAHEQTGEDDYLNSAIETNRAILQTFELLKLEFDSKLDKQFLAETAYPIFHNMLALVHTAYQNNSSPELFDLALNISEMNKDFLLLEALRNANATQYGNISEHILNKESRLRAEITHLEKVNFTAPEENLEFSEELFARKQEYYSFLDTLKLQYPKYHALKYRNKALHLTSVKNILANDEVLISYTMADRYLYLIVIGSEEQNFLKIPFDDSDRAAIRQFYKLLSNPSITDNSVAIHSLAQRLYSAILEEVLVDFQSTNLTIIPDGELHYLPFDLLQESGSYLLETKSIGYVNSVTSLLELKDKKSTKKNTLLAFAPSFRDTEAISTDRQFGKLLYNDDEVGKIAPYFDGEVVLDNNATLSNFRTKAPNFNLLHLATHASANDEFPDYSYIAFSDISKNEEDYILYIKDLYNTSLEVDMVTLSACQTGIGKLQKGQGMMSLSKGFYYAGAKSLVTTLWKINDKSSVKLMEYFYENLSAGQSKKVALSNAKLRYLETTDDDLLKHPYYWAAFVVSGNMTSLDTAIPYGYWFFLIIPILIVVGIKRKKKINRE